MYSIECALGLVDIGCQASQHILGGPFGSDNLLGCLDTSRYALGVTDIIPYRTVARLDPSSAFGSLFISLLGGCECLLGF